MSGPAGYCIATGVLPAARRRGVLQAMAATASQRLASRGIRRQRLEVIADNAAALAAYTSLGFQAHRRLDCYRIEQAIVAPPGDWTLQEGDRRNGRVGSWISNRQYPIAATACNGRGRR